MLSAEVPLLLGSLAHALDELLSLFEILQNAPFVLLFELLLGFRSALRLLLDRLLNLCTCSFRLTRLMLIANQAWYLMLCVHDIDLRRARFDGFELQLLGFRLLMLHC